MKTKRQQVLFILFLCGLISINAQSFSKDQSIQGYAVIDDELIFIFDEAQYGIKPQRVFVTGEFRDWDGSTKTKKWDLKKKDTLWTLSIRNKDLATVKPNTKFKFRINQGEWMSPLKEAKNKRGGDLVFMMQFKRNSLKAEIINETLILAEATKVRPLESSQYQITNAQGDTIQVDGVLPNGEKTTLIKPALPLDPKRVYFLEIPSLHLKTQCLFDGWFKQLYSTKELGANIRNDSTTVRIFAPRANQVKVYLYKERNDESAFLIGDLIEDHQGVWEIHFPENLHGVYYDFTIHGSNDPGNYFYETHPVHINDPYARVSDDTWGKARIWENTKPASPLKHGIPKMKDIIAYEVHVQDFTDNLPLRKEHKGTFKGMIQRDLKNANGESIGFDYLVDLGINVIHLMPVQEYLHYPDEDWKASFNRDEYMIDQGVNEENYQWGYRTTFAMAIESRYRTKGQEPGKEREEFRDLVQAFHDQGIAVIVDIVPNHTGENMDGNNYLFNFNVLDKQYYYRTKNFEHIGAYGNEVKTENRPMTQRWLIDQCLSLINEFGVDGFRIDLAGQIDEQTLKALIHSIGKDKIVYGEAWIGSNDPEFENNPEWDWYKEDAPITFFQDDARNAFKGGVFELNDKYKDRGWPGGFFDARKEVIKGLQNIFDEEKSPLSGINYLDIHDNFTLADQFGSINFDGRRAVDQDRYKIATTLLYTSLGPIVTHGGSEIMRSKAHAPLKEVIKETKKGIKIYMHGYRDTYNHRKANQFIWKTVGQKPDKKNSNDYKKMHAFWKGLNAFRLSKAGEVFRKEEAVSQQYYQWITPEDKSLLGYIVDQSVMILLNAGENKNTFKEVTLPKGEWRLIGNNNQIDHVNGVRDKKFNKTLMGSKKYDFEMDKEALLIWLKKQSP